MLHKQAHTQQTKTPHYLALDGLRGVAALLVVWYHIFEAFASSPLDQVVNHGYLAVDFFFLLSGFVVAHAYDSQWGVMRLKDFFTRRLIRLHPMLLFGAVLGAVMFYSQSNPTQPLHLVPFGTLLLVMLANMLLLPASPNLDIRGYTEIFPLNGPTWSLFFEYLANILYALILRRLSTYWLALVVGLSAIALAYEGLVHAEWAYLGAGWSFADEGFWGGMARVVFSFSAGMLLRRTFRPRALKYGFTLGAIILTILLLMPRIGGSEAMWQNALYELISVCLIFPCILYTAACSQSQSLRINRLWRWLGDLSYPLYIIHYPFIYLYISWVRTEGLSFEQSLLGALSLFVGCIVLAQLLIRYYDKPIRQKLSQYGLR